MTATEALDVLANGESLSRHEDVQAALAELARLRAVEKAAMDVVAEALADAGEHPTLEDYDGGRILDSTLMRLNDAIDGRPDAGKET